MAEGGAGTRRPALSPCMAESGYEASFVLGRVFDIQVSASH